MAVLKPSTYSIDHHTHKHEHQPEDLDEARYIPRVSEGIKSKHLQLRNLLACLGGVHPRGVNPLSDVVDDRIIRSQE